MSYSSLPNSATNPSFVASALTLSRRIVICCATLFSLPVSADAFIPSTEGPSTIELKNRLEQMEQNLLLFQMQLKEEKEKNQEKVESKEQKKESLLDTTELNLEQEITINQALLSRFEKLGKVNGKHIIKEGDTVFVLNDKEFNLYLEKQYALIGQAIKKNTFLPNFASVGNQVEGAVNPASNSASDDQDDKATSLRSMPAGSLHDIPSPNNHLARSMILTPPPTSPLKP